jgi:hypothetical protein
MTKINLDELNPEQLKDIIMDQKKKMMTLRIILEASKSKCRELDDQYDQLSSVLMQTRALLNSGL